MSRPRATSRFRPRPGPSAPQVRAERLEVRAGSAPQASGARVPQPSGRPALGAGAPPCRLDGRLRASATPPDLRQPDGPDAPEAAGAAWTLPFWSETVSVTKAGGWPEQSSSSTTPPQSVRHSLWRLRTRGPLGRASGRIEWYPTLSSRGSGSCSTAALSERRRTSLTEAGTRLVVSASSHNVEGQSAGPVLRPPVSTILRPRADSERMLSNPH